ncbi:GPR1/FUN34/yaaH family-domain-containing protein [Phakopsora pachyrhizi]|uniref:GPR1/FUN34/yaaH family-domain-containing protein n=1 Tax=Phakopsora pachyrhizi TaxID=170000 RepID=A0AAV0AL05_PHAPC|nr:GPR1/FUN34/yaaH family-domain-containing protein [Phakopsora pachyrhizi]
MSNSKIEERTETLGNQPTLTTASSDVIHHHQDHRFESPKFANPAPLGLCSFAATTFLLSLINMQCRGVKINNLVLSMAFGYGGIAQFLAGMWEFASGNTFGATAFSAYGGFWFSFGLILLPSTGVVASYASSTAELENALGFYLFSWFIFTTIMLIASFKTSVGLVALFFFLDITFLLLGVGKFYPEKESLTKAGGAFGLITSFIAWYCAAAILFKAEKSQIKLPDIDLKNRSSRNELK